MSDGKPKNMLKKAFEEAKANPGKMIILSSSVSEGTVINVADGPPPEKTGDAKERYGSENAFEGPENHPSI